MTTFLLIRHAHWDGVGRVLAGRLEGVRLSPTGVAEAARLANALGNLALAAVYTSPLERARETAAPLARARGLQAQEEPRVLELDFGRWTGEPIGGLRDDPAWRRFNEERATARIPGGETMAEAVARAREALYDISCRWGDALVAVVTHGDIVRGLVADALALPLDRMLQLEVEPASVSILVTGPPARVPLLNWRADHLGGLPLKPF
jgi:broad specificity phosphatase PhoE